MTSVRFVFPKLRLAELLKTPGGLSVADALSQAESNLEQIRPTCHAELLELLQAAEGVYADLGAGFDDQGMANLYAVAVRGIGGGAVSGVPAVDAALTSLCDLLDQLRSSQRYDRAAIGVHLQSWRLLMNQALPGAGAAAVLDGLRKVSAHYAQRAEAG